jgi:alkylation response protein AidB-like acyl-CoA dehydrogenase
MSEPRNTTAGDRSRAVAESARERSWRGDSFLRDLFMGEFRLDLLHPFPVPERERPVFRRFYDDLAALLRARVDPVEIDRTGEIPRAVVSALADIGAFGMKIPVEYGGLGLRHGEYVRVMQMLGSHDANVTALLSAHQAIGVPQPVKLFGTEEQKRRLLPRCARGAISAFALTEAGAGSDPASLATEALRDPAGGWVLDGEKLWCTNGTLAQLILVMARHPESGKISAFVVDTSWPGVSVQHRCRFMGLRALANGVIRLSRVRVPAENLVGREGDGLRIALTTLNTGRLTLPAATSGLALRCLEICRKWANARVQWGLPIGRHEAVAHVIGDIASTSYAMETLAYLVADMADRDDYDIRLEAAAAKEWNTVQGWRIADATLQIRGGRGYETEQSLAARGEPAIGIERHLRDSRINRIFEGSSEIMHLFMAREAVDRHIKVAGKLVDPGASPGQRLAALPRIAGFYAWWYPSRWLGWGAWPRYREFGPLATHVRDCDRGSRRLARAIFHGMVRHGAALERRQAFLFRIVDIAIELFAVAAVCSRAWAERDLAPPHRPSSLELADLFCRGARRRIAASFDALWRNDDAARYRLAGHVLDGEYTWLERAALALPYDEPDLVPGERDGEAEPKVGSIGLR